MDNKPNYDNHMRKLSFLGFGVSEQNFGKIQLVQ